MYFDSRNGYFSSTWLDGTGRVAASVASVDQRLSFSDEPRREDHRSDREILAMPGNHGLGYLGQLHEEGVLRLFFLAQFRLLRRWLVRRRHDSDFLALSHHACPERWCSSADGPLSNSSKDALSHSRSAIRR